MEYVFLSIIALLMIIALTVMGWALATSGSSYIKEDGTIIEWDHGGGGRILRPNGDLEEYPPKQEP